MKASPIVSTLKALAVAGNVLFILWMAYNGIDEAGHVTPTPYQVMSYIGLTALLVLNSVLLWVR